MHFESDTKLLPTLFDTHLGYCIGAYSVKMFKYFQKFEVLTLEKVKRKKKAIYQTRKTNKKYDEQRSMFEQL